MSSEEPERLSSSDVLGMLTGSPEDLKRTRFRISRPCYDKYHRCPGWAGGGARYAKVRRCENGRLPYLFELPLWKWRLNRCPRCGVIVLPYHVRWLDWRWWRWEISSWIGNARYAWETRKK